MSWWVPIVVAVITGPVVVLLEKLRKENTAQHAESRGLLDNLVVNVLDLKDSIHEHRLEFKEHLADHNRKESQHDVF